MEATYRSVSRYVSVGESGTSLALWNHLRSPSSFPPSHFGKKLIREKREEVATFFSSSSSLPARTRFGKTNLSQFTEELNPRSERSLPVREKNGGKQKSRICDLGELLPSFEGATLRAKSAVKKTTREMSQK